MRKTGFNLFTGNRLENLAESLAETIAEPLASPFAPEIVVLQSKGMERWLSMEIAQKKGICANFSFSFPNTFFYNLCKEIIPDIPGNPLFETDLLTFTIMKLLLSSSDLSFGSSFGSSGFATLERYLGDKNDSLKLFQISEKIADIFQQYIIFRPEMILKWEKGDEEDIWQAELWRKIVKEKGVMHPARLRKTLIETLRYKSVPFANLPQRISVFGISYLPEFHMQIFAALSSIIEINIYLLNPCKEYWGDILSGAEINKIKKKYLTAGGTTDELYTDELYLENGNSLLASLGKLGRDFFEFINGIGCNIDEQFHEIFGAGMLAHIQNDILCMQEKQYQINPKNDKSIHIHSCHSPMREIEVLHNNLLAMFEEDGDLLPKDIIVMAPDIELYAPYIHAVFGLSVDKKNRIPFSIADRNVKKESSIIDAFLLILNLSDSRLGVTEVLDLLEPPAIKEKFCPGKFDLEIIENWIRETNIRWGIDKESRIKLDLPGFSENTWKSGLDKLLLGYAMPGYGENIFSGILPYDNIEGENVEILSRFLDFTEALFSCVEALNRERSLTDWGIYLNKIIDDFFSLNDDGEFEIQIIRDIFNGLQTIEAVSGFNKKINIDVLKSYLAGSLQKKSFDSGFISGGVTFCSMLPMRSIPCKVVCLIGMNHDAFPGDSQSLSFDLIAKKPKVLDRSKRNDDKYLFLESIISAKDRLYISYIGQSIQDNTLIPPSVLVSELIDYMEKNFSVPDERIENHLVTKSNYFFITNHRLQAFSQDYFKKGSGLFSYSKENYNAARALYIEVKQDLPRFLSAGIAPINNSSPCNLTDIAIEDLFNFFSHPVKYFLNKRFGIYLSESSRSRDERENFNLDGLDKYIVGNALVKIGSSGINLNEYLPVQKAEGRLPHGNIGDYLYMDMSADAAEFVKRIKKYTQGNRFEPLEFSIDIKPDIKSDTKPGNKEFNLHGSLGGLYDHGIVTIRYGRRRAQDFLRAWISHLVLCSLNNKKFLCKSFLVCKDSVSEFAPVEQSNKILYELISIFIQGLSKSVKFFPALSLQYAKELLQENKPLETVLKSAIRLWEGNDYNKGESEDLYNRLCFGKAQAQTESPVDEDFQSISKKIFSPLFDHCM